MLVVRGGLKCMVRWCRWCGDVGGGEVGGGDMDGAKV